MPLRAAPRWASVPGQGPGRAASSTTPSCSPRVTAATSWTGTATGRWTRSSPTWTPAGTSFHVAIENWQHDFNIGTIVRTANAFLAAEVHIVGNRRWNRRGAMVTDRYQHVRHHATVADLAASPARAPGTGRRCWASTTCPAPRTSRRPTLPRRVCLLFGQEGPGLSESARAACDATFSIAQFGSTRSINASAAAAIAMHAWMRDHADLTRACLARLTASPQHWGEDVPARWLARTPLVQGVQMPIATPEKYAEMLDAAKANAFAFPAINVSSSQTLNAALQGFAEAGSDGIIQVSTGGAEYLSGPASRTWSPARSRSRPTPPRWRRTTRSTSRCTPTTAPRTSSTGSSGRCSTSPPSGWREARTPLFQSHMWDGSAVPLDENLQIAEELLAHVRQATHHPRDRGRRRRRRGGRRRRRDQREALHHPRGRPRHRRGPGHRRERPLPDRPDLRQRARRLQAGQRQAAPGDPQERAGGGGRRSSAWPRAPSRSTWSSTAGPARLPEEIARPSTTAWSR